MSEMPKGEIEVVDFNHYNRLLEMYWDKIIAVNFWSPPCGHCMTFAPVYVETQKKYGDRLVFLKANVAGPAGVLAQRLTIRGVPTIVFGVGNTLVYKQVGAPPAYQFQQLLDQVIVYVQQHPELKEMN